MFVTTDNNRADAIPMNKHIAFGYENENLTLFSIKTALLISVIEQKIYFESVGKELQK